MKIRVEVMPKAAVLDPQGKAIARALMQLGFDGVDDARQGKVIEITLAHDDRARAEKDAKAMAEKLLANGVVEDFRVVVL